MLTGLSAQQVLKLGSGHLALQDNMEEVMRGGQGRDAVPPDHVQQMVLRFDQLPTARQKAELRRQGIELHSYISHNMYYATVSGNAEAALQAACSGRAAAPRVRQANLVDPLWKVSPEVSSGRIPEWAKGSKAGMARIIVEFFKWANPQDVSKHLANSGIRVVNMMDKFHMAEVEMPVAEAVRLAENGWVRWIGFVPPPAEPENAEARSMSRANVLSQASNLGGYGLTGKGQHVGIWDGSIEAHPDLGDRLVTHEFQYISDHGQHTSGTLAGAGILDPRAKGIAPEAMLHAWNFNVQANGLSVEEEMYLTAAQYGMRVSSHSYGISMTVNQGDRDAYCVNLFRYRASDANLDLLTNELFPDMLHLFSAGNDQAHCLNFTGSRYGTSTKRVKNAVLVGALNEDGSMSSYSSWGPMDDGRMMPHIAVTGTNTYSTVYNMGYEDGWQGTSMACPAAAGTMTLLYQLYEQIHGQKPLAALAKAVMLNSGHDRGNVGPDYQFGFGVLDGLRSARMIEKKQHFVGEVDHGDEQTFTINVPSNTAELRVMLVWSDVPASEGARPALVNDLDLLVEADGTIYKPWVLDPKNPSKPAYKGTDRLNNAEQVTITNPAAGSYTIKVSGYAIPEGPQQFAIAYDCHRAGVELTYPNGGETFMPKQQVLARWITTGLAAPISIELSTDGGATFTTAVSNIPASQTEAIVTMPDVTTGKAMMRIRQGNAVDITQSTFALMGVPTDLQVQSATPCDASSYKLAWWAVDGAAEYAVLKLDEANGTYVELGRTNDTVYTLPTLGAERNIYSVAAISADGAKSERAVAVMATTSQPLNLVSLPFKETFTEFLSPYIALNSGEYVEQTWAQSPFEYSRVQMVVFKGTGANAAWNASGDLFEANPANVATARICQVDASHVRGPLWLRMAAALHRSGVNNAALRVVVNGTDVIADNLGRTSVQQLGDDNFSHYDLSAYAGTTFSVSIEAVLRNGADELQLGYIELWQPTKDVEMLAAEFANVPTTSAQETLSIALRNNGYETLTNLPVRYRINGGTPVTELIPGPIAPLSTIDYIFKQNVVIADDDVMYTVEAEVLYDGDINTANNTASAQTYRNGTSYTRMLCGVNNTQLTATSSPQYFTDNGGKLGNYSDNCTSALTIKTATAGKRVQLRIVEFDVEADYDYLYIYDGDSESASRLARLSGDSIAINGIQSTNGGAGVSSLYVKLETDAGVSAPGFVIEYMEVDSSTAINTFTLSSIESVERGNYISDGGLPVIIKMQNNSTEVQTDVVVRYRVDEGQWVTDTIASVPVGEYTYAFKQKLSLPDTVQQFMLRAVIATEDAQMGDNTAERRTYSDYYCIPLTTIKTSGGIYIAQATYGDVSFTMQTVTRSPLSLRSTVFVGYQDFDNNKLVVRLPNGTTTGALGVWVDWNDDRVFDNTEGQVVALASGQTSYEFSFDLTDKPVGKHNLRIRVGNFDVTPCDDATETGQFGQTADFTFEVQAHNSVLDYNDVGISAIEIPGGTANLTNAETVEVELYNHSVARSCAGFELKLIVDGLDVATETYTGTMAPGEIVRYAFGAKADLSAVGRHTVEVEIAVPDDIDQFDNRLSISIFNEAPSVQAGEWMLSFDGADDAVNAGTLGGANLQSYTYEAWINPNSCGGYGSVGFGRVFAGKGLMLFANGLATSQFYPMNSFVLSVGESGSYYSNNETFKIGQWQHVAVTHDAATHEVKLYINGQEATLTTRTAVENAMADNSAAELYIGNQASLDRQFDGLIDNARVWNVVRSQAEIEADMGSATTLAGAAGLLAEFLFNEGPFTSTTANTADGTNATILNAVLDDSEHSIWQAYKVLRSFSVDGQVTDWLQVAPNRFRAEVNGTVDVASLAVTALANFASAELTVDGTPIASGDVLDFSTPVTLTASMAHLGATLSETYTFEVAPASSLLSFGLPAAGLSLSTPVPMLIEVEASGAAEAMVTEFTASNNATVLFNGVARVSGDVVDYTTPVIVDVLGLSGAVNASYTVLVRQPQTIIWGTMTQSHTYGDPSFELNATASSGARLTFESSNPSVISVNGGRAYIMGAGTATITAQQLGNQGLIPAAAPTAVTISVAKAPLTISADTLTISQLDPMPELTMSLSGFVNGDDASTLDELPSIATAADASEAGTFDITLTGGHDANYTYTLVNGQLIVNPADVHTLTFSVMHGGQPVQGAAISIDGQNLTTDANGRANLRLLSADYDYTVSANGLEPYTGSVTLSGNTSLAVNLTAPLPIYPITYSTDGHGTIVDYNGVVNEPQRVVRGQNTQPVEALAHNGYLFIQWNDGRTDNPRQDYNVLATATYTAQFAIKTFTLTYTAGEGGSISGETMQTVEFGQTGTAVTAIANPGYLFVRWSDGNPNPTRADSPAENMVVEAEFEQIFILPYVQTFDADTAPAYWSTANNSGGYAEWEFAASAGTNTLKGSAPNHAVLNDINLSGGKDANADLISPLFDFTNLREVSLSFKHYHYNRYTSGGTPVSTISVFYSVDDGDWTLLKQWQGTTGNPDSYEWTTTSDEICGHSKVRFKLNFYNRLHSLAATYAGSACWLVDDFSLIGVPNADSYTVTYRAGNGGILQGANAEGMVTADVPDGSSGPAVTAVPDAGYVFKGWSDGSTDNPRTDVVNRPIDVTALFQLDCNIPISSLPWQYSFEQGLPDCWNVEQNVGVNASYGWFFDDNQAKFYYMGVGIADGTLTSPLFDLSAAMGDDVFISFYSSFNNYKLYPEDVWLEYTTNNGATWDMLWICDRTATPSRVSGNYNYFNEDVSVKLPALSSTMRFRWAFKGTITGQVAGWWDISDIAIYTSNMRAIEYISNNNGQYYLGTIRRDGQSSGYLKVIETIGSSVTVTAEPIEGYHFMQWNDSHATATRTDVVSAKDTFFIAQFAIDTFQLTYGVVSDGMVRMADVNSAEHTQLVTYGGTSVAVEAIPDEDFKFVRWDDGRTDNPRVDTDVKSNLSVKAVFERLQTFNIAATASSTDYGEVAGAGPYREGTTVTLTATAKDGSAFVRWTSNGVEVSTQNPFTFVAASDSTLVAEFNVASFDLIYSATLGGYIDGVARQHVTYGKDATPVEAKAVEGFGYRFAGWSDGSTNATRTDLNITTDLNVTAEFKKITYQLYYLSGAGGKLIGDSIQTLEHGASGTAITAVPNVGYMFMGWSDGYTDSVRLDANVQSELTLVARFEPIRYELALQVLDENAKPLAGAKVTLGSTAMATDAQGMVVDTLVPGKYAYSVELEGYIKQSGEVQLASDTLVKLVLSRATGLRGLELAPLSVYPNPTSGELWVAVPESAEGTSELRVYGASGQLVLRVSMHGASASSAAAAGRIRIDLSGQPAGVYIVRVGSAAAKVVLL